MITNVFILLLLQTLSSMNDKYTSKLWLYRTYERGKFIFRYDFCINIDFVGGGDIKICISWQLEFLQTKARSHES